MTRQLVDLGGAPQFPLPPLLNPHVRAILDRLTTAEHQRFLNAANRRGLTLEQAIEQGLDRARAIGAARRS